MRRSHPQSTPPFVSLAIRRVVLASLLLGTLSCASRGTKDLTTTEPMSGQHVAGKDGRRDAGGGVLSPRDSVATSSESAKGAPGPNSGPLPGQVMVDPAHPGALVYNRDNDNNGRLDPFVLVSPGDPEGFLFMPAGEQDAIIEKMRAHGGNGLYLQIVRSHGGDGDPTQNPFLGKDPQRGIDTALLSSWEQLFTRLDEAGIVIYLFFYDDGAAPFGRGDAVTAAEDTFLRGVVNKFSHHKHLIWCVAEEYEDALTTARVSAIATVVAKADTHNHVLAVHHATGDNSYDFVDTAQVTQFAHQPNSTGAAALHADVLAAIASTGGHVSVNMAENWNGGRNDHAAAVRQGNRREIRLRNWSTVMAGAHVMVVGSWHPKVGRPLSDGMLADMRTLQTFMEATPYNEMTSRDELCAGDAEWMLSTKGAHVAFARKGFRIGVKDLPAGSYKLLWLDASNGRRVEKDFTLNSKQTTVLRKPSGFGPEVALYLSCTDCQE